MAFARGCSVWVCNSTFLMIACNWKQALLVVLGIQNILVHGNRSCGRWRLQGIGFGVRDL